MGLIKLGAFLAGRNAHASRTFVNPESVHSRRSRSMYAVQVLPSKRHRKSALLAIGAGGLVAGAFDLTSAFITYGWGVPRAIASGVLGSRAFQGGTGTWLLGVLLHFVIAFGAAAIYCAASRKLDFLKQHFLVCGLFFGIAVYLVMNLVVVPLSAAPFRGRPFTEAAMIQGLLIHMFLIGLPISLSTAKLSK